MGRWPTRRITDDVLYILGADEDVLLAFDCDTDGMEGKVFEGINDHLFGPRARGRMPFVEVAVDGGNQDSQTTDGGEMRATIRLRVKVAGFNEQDKRDAAQSLLAICVRAIKTWYIEPYDAGGYDRFPPDTPPTPGTAYQIYGDSNVTYENERMTPHMASLDARIDVVMSYDEATQGEAV